MRRSSGFSLSLAGFVAASLAPAAAADLLPQAPSMIAPAPASSWQGFYVGAFGGGTFGGTTQSYSASSKWLSANLPALLPFVDSVGSQSLGFRGADVGVEAGYDWKLLRQFVVGVAGDMNWSDLGGSRVTNGTLPLIAFPYTISQKLSSEWQGSLRVRAGYAPTDNLLVYATGGLALGDFSYTAAFTDILQAPFNPGVEAENANFHRWRAGWTLGGGAEWALNQNWSIKGEYRYTDYDTIGGMGVLPLQQPPSIAYINHSTGGLRVNSLRAGIDYHFE